MWAAPTVSLGYVFLGKIMHYLTQKTCLDRKICMKLHYSEYLDTILASIDGIAESSVAIFMGPKTINQ